MSGTVTIIVPAHNAAAFIAETLRSVVSQTWPAHQLEIRVVDDGSSDDTAAVADRELANAGADVEIIRHNTPQGPSAARNAGLARSSGSIVQFLDADDLLAPDKIARQHAALASAAPDVASVSSRWALFDTRPGDGAARIGGDVRTPSLGQDPMAAILETDGFIHTGAQLFRREWLERVGGFDARHWLIEDVDLQLRLMMAGATIAQVGSAEPLFFYRQRAGSLSRTNHRAFVDAVLRNADAAQRFWSAQGTLSPSRRRTLARIHVDAARFFADHDADAFAREVAVVEQLVPAFVPDHPARLKWLSRAVGFGRAERLAAAYRRWRRVARRSGVHA